MKMKLLVLFATLVLISASFCCHADIEIGDLETGCKIWNSRSLVGYTVTWTGKCKNGKADGIGSLQWFYNKLPQGRYDGDYVLGKMHGHGTYAMDDGSR